MAQLTVPQVAALWLDHGGPDTKVVDAVATAWAESGGSTDAVSPDGKVGLWQIRPALYQAHGYDAAGASNPPIAAQLAIFVTSGGSNWGSMCSCYRNWRTDCNTRNLASPEPGSPADGFRDWVSAQLGTPVAGLPGPTGGTGYEPAPNTDADGVRRAWDAMRSYWNGGAGTHHDGFSQVIDNLRRIG